MLRHETFGTLGDTMMSFSTIDAMEITLTTQIPWRWSEQSYSSTPTPVKEVKLLAWKVPRLVPVSLNRD